MDLDKLRQYALSLPAATEEIKWDNDLVFLVGGKMFCVVTLDPPQRCSFKVPDDAYEELAATDGFAPAPYLARAKWVQVTRPEALHAAEWKSFIKESYALVVKKLTKRQRQELGLT